MGRVLLLVLSEKKVTNYELTACARDGKETVVSYNATTFYDRDRKLQGVFAAARDVTESKRLDQVLQAQNIELESAKFAAEQANLAKSDLLSSMSQPVGVGTLRTQRCRAGAGSTTPGPECVRG